MAQDYKLKFLRTQPLLSGFNDKQIGFLSDIAEEITLNPGEYAIKEGEKSNDIFFIMSGIFEVTKENPSGEAFIIDEIKEDNVFGEVAFIDSKPRSSSVRAKTPSILLKLPFNDVKPKKGWISSILDPSIKASTFDLLYENIIKESFNRIRKTNQKYVVALKDQIQQAERQNDFGAFFVFIITFFSTYNLLLNLLTSKQIFHDAFLLILTSLILLGTNIFFVIKRKISFAKVGLTWQNGLHSFLESLAIIFFGLLSFGAIFSYSGGSWDSFSQELRSGLLRLIEPISIPIFFYVFTLEFVVRGVILSSLRRFLEDVPGIKSIIITSIFLVPVNLQQGFDILIIKFYIDVFLGFIYVKQRSLIGVTLIHYLIIQLLMLYY